MLPAILRRLLNIGPSPPSDPWDATTQELRRLFPVAPICHVCDLALAGHSYASLSVAGNKTDMLKLAEALDARQWEVVAAIQSFEGLKDAFSAKAILCPKSTGWVLLYLDPSELYESKQLLKTYLLSAEEWSSLLNAFQNLEWHTF